MAAVEDYDFSQGEAGASETIPMEAGQIRKGGLIMIKGQPCKVADVSTSKTGKHGHAKCNFIAYNIFNNKKLEDMIPSTHGTTVPVVTRTEYTLVDINDEDFMSLMDDAGEVSAAKKFRKQNFAPLRMQKNILICYLTVLFTLECRCVKT